MSSFVPSHLSYMGLVSISSAFLVSYLKLNVSFFHGAIFIPQNELNFLKLISVSGSQVHCS